MCLLLFGQFFRAQKIVNRRTVLLSFDGNEFGSDKLGKVVFDAADTA